MLRLFLVLAFLAALAALGIGQFMVKPKVDELNATVATVTGERDKAQTDKQAADKKAKEATAVAEKAVKESSAMKVELETTTAEAVVQRARADKASADRDVVTKTKNESQEKLARWEGLGLQPEGVVKIKEAARKFEEEKDIVVAENKVLLFDINLLANKLKKYEGDNSEVVLPKGLHGAVTAVSPASDFVFLDIGSNHGVLERGKMMVHRGGKLITKVMIVSVDTNRSVANILKDWSQGDLTVQVGDGVLY
ncbi:MAG: hypothetical protein EXS36_17255 [Pedosphaera sp.]|nr:hypothetical protein [Pedosphaera sp.]